MSGMGSPFGENFAWIDPFRIVSALYRARRLNVIRFRGAQYAVHPRELAALIVTAPVTVSPT
jgi:hypothetical protein